MNHCIGWPGACAIYGDMHGCALPDGHLGLNHVCQCGTESRAYRKRGPRRPSATEGVVLQLRADGKWVTIGTYSHEEAA